MTDFFKAVFSRITFGNVMRLGTLVAVVWCVWAVLTSDRLAIKSIEITGPVESLGLEEVTRTVSERIDGNLLTVDIEGIKRSVESIEWIHSAEVTRLWPDSLYVRVERHRAVAIWDDGRLVSDKGILFTSNDEPIDNLVRMPAFGGDPQYVAEIVRLYPLFQAEAAKIKARVKAVNVTFRGSWSVVLDSDDFEGMTVELGRELATNGPVLRLAQVADNFEHVCEMMQGWPVRIDARYRNAFAVKLPDQKGKESWRTAQAKRKNGVANAGPKTEPKAQPVAATTSVTPTVNQGKEIDLSAIIY